MGKKSAGILVYRYKDDLLEVFLVHPGGPFWKNKDEGAWSIPKGEYEEGDDPFAVAKREFNEETGFHIDEVIKKPTFQELETLKQPSGKRITAWTAEGDCDSTAIKSNLFSMEWPPRSGKQAQFPEVDRADWFLIKEAHLKILKGQKDFIDQLCKLLNYDFSKENLKEKEKGADSKTVKKGIQLSLFEIK